jgi:hypothetical protein
MTEETYMKGFASSLALVVSTAVAAAACGGSSDDAGLFGNNGGGSAGSVSSGGAAGASGGGVGGADAGLGGGPSGTGGGASGGGGLSGSGGQGAEGGSAGSSLDAGPEYTLDNVCQKLPAQTCALRKPCCDSAGGYVEGECVSRETAACKLLVGDVTNGKRVFDPDKIAECFAGA